MIRASPDTSPTKSGEWWSKRCVNSISKPSFPYQSAEATASSGVEDRRRRARSHALDDSGRRVYASSTIVTGPSFTSATSMRAPKTPRDTGTPSPREHVAEHLVQRLCLRGIGRVREARAVPLPRVRDEGELAHDERLALNVEERAVEPAFLVLEDPQPRDLAREPARVLLAVAARHAEQHDDPRPGRADDALVDGDGGLAHSLDHGPHRAILRTAHAEHP